MRVGHVIRPLDRYVFSEFWRIFVTTALGFPVLVIIIDLTDNLNTYLERHLSYGRIAESYVYWLPDSMFMVLPAAVLFATVFSIGALTRHSEITAAKASGISFYRFIAPIFFGAVLAVALGLVLGEVAPHTNAKRLALLETQKFANNQDRFNFAYAAEAGRVYKVGAMHVTTKTAAEVQIERKGHGRDYPSYIASSAEAHYEPARGGWVMGKGVMHLLTGDTTNVTFTYDSLQDRLFTERPEELMASSKAPADMDFAELGRFIRAMERSGADVNELRVERMLKIAVPVTSLVILLFGAPLATSTQRGGTAYGVAISLATTVIVLTLIQLTKAIGGKGLMPPDLAAWLPNMIFALLGGVLFLRVRT